MSQLVAGICSDGVFAGADRRVEIRDPQGSRTASSRKLFALGRNAAIATSGAAVGITISLEAAKLLSGRPHLTFGEVEEFTLDHFQRRYGEFVSLGREWFGNHPEALTLSYLLLAGIGDSGEPKFRFYASESHGEPYRALPTGPVLAAPRRLGMEARLLSALSAGASVREARTLAVKDLGRIASLEEAVAPPFDFAVIGPAGMKLETFEEI